MDLFNFGRAFLGHTRLFLTLPDSIGIVTGFFDKLGLLDVGDSTGAGPLDSTDTSSSTGTITGGFNSLGFLYIIGSRGNVNFFFDLKIVRVRLTVRLKSTVARSRI